MVEYPHTLSLCNHERHSNEAMRTLNLTFETAPITDELNIRMACRRISLLLGYVSGVKSAVAKERLVFSGV